MLCPECKKGNLIKHYNIDTSDGSTESNWYHCSNPRCDTDFEDWEIRKILGA